MPRAVGIVTSLQAAALHDVLTAFRRRAPQVRLVVYPSPVQGAEAPPALVAALAAANLRQEVDTLLLVRGGGSLEDLWAFNDERVVRAVAAQPHPGGLRRRPRNRHHAVPTWRPTCVRPRPPRPPNWRHRRAPTCWPCWRRARPRCSGRLRVPSTARRSAWTRWRCAWAGRRPACWRSSSRCRRLGPRLQQALRVQLARQVQAPALLAARLQRALAVQLQRAQAGLDARAQRLDALDPHQVLHRGYAWVEGADGRPVVSALALQPGQAVTAVWADGRASARSRT